MGGQDLDELAEFIGDDRAPALADVAVERERLVLGEDVDVAQVGVDAVGQGDVDNAVLAGERYGGLGAVAGQGKQPFAGTTGEQNTQAISHDALPSANPFGAGSEALSSGDFRKEGSMPNETLSLATREYHAPQPGMAGKRQRPEVVRAFVRWLELLSTPCLLTRFEIFREADAQRLAGRKHRWRRRFPAQLRRR